MAGTISALASAQKSSQVLLLAIRGSMAGYGSGKRLDIPRTGPRDNARYAIPGIWKPWHPPADLSCIPPAGRRQISETTIFIQYNMIEHITSLQNPRVKRYVRLRDKSSARRSDGVFCVEGVREISHCLHSGYEIETIFLAPSIASMSPGDILSNRPCPHVISVSEAIYARMALRGDTEGVVAIFNTREKKLHDLDLPPTPLLTILESVEKPGNLGAVLRSADAAGVDAVIICDPLTDIYNPNLIRASLGAVFTVPCVTCPSSECISFLKANGIQILTAQLQDSSLYYDTDMRRPTAIVMGTEAAGLSQIWREAADAHIRIPMLGDLDSLNVSVSAAILMFEAVRQRTTTNSL